MQQQTAVLTLLAGALVGTSLVIARKGFDDVPLEAGHDALHNLKPGDEITIRVVSDEGWVERQRQAEERTRLEAQQADQDKAAAAFDASKPLTDLDAQAAADIAANPQAGEDLTGKPGMTLAEGLDAADRQQPDVDAGAGTVAADDGAQVTRSTAAPAGTGTTSPTRATRSTKS